MNSLNDKQVQLLNILKDTYITFYHLEKCKKHLESNRKDYSDFEKIMTIEDINDTHVAFMKWEREHCVESSTKAGQVIDYVSFNPNN